MVSLIPFNVLHTALVTYQLRVEFVIRIICMVLIKWLLSRVRL